MTVKQSPVIFFNHIVFLNPDDQMNTAWYCRWIDPPLWKLPKLWMGNTFLERGPFDPGLANILKR